MPDRRFFKPEGPFTLEKLAEICDAEFVPGSESGRMYNDVAPLQAAGPQEISFLDNPRYVEAFEKTEAGACIVDPRYRDRAPKGMALLLSERPYRAYARVANAFYPRMRPEAGIHPSAHVDSTAKVGEGSHVGPNAVVEAAVEIGRDCVIGPNAVVGENVLIGDETMVGANASLAYCHVGRRCNIHPGARIGTRGFGFSMDPEGYEEIPQLGRVLIEDDVEVGANSTIDRGAGPDTVIGAGTRIDNLVQIGHNVRIGRQCILIAQSGVAGSTELEDYVVLAAQSGAAGHLHLGKGAQLGGASGLMHDIPEGQRYAGLPAMPAKDYFRLVALWRRQIKSKGRGNE